MGKIRVKTLGDEQAEKEQKKDAEKRHEQKKTVKAPGMKGGERVVAVGPTEEELQAVELKEAPEEIKEEKKSKKETKEQEAFRSQKYQSLSTSFDKSKAYSLSEALNLLDKLQRGGFDETVELHINTNTLGISGNVTLPNGTGKKTRVAIASDTLIAEVEKGIINFDILVAEPAMMAKLARVAKILGPRGLMPNPKNGTITSNPEEIVKKYEGGQISFKTEAKSPIMHLTVGKMSFGHEKLTQNIDAMINAVKKSNIVNVTLKSTMSPGIKVNI